MSAVLDALQKKFGTAILATDSRFGDDVVEIGPDKLVELATWLKTDPAMAFDCPVFVTCTDRLGFPVPPDEVSKFKFSAADDRGPNPAREASLGPKEVLHDHAAADNIRPDDVVDEDDRGPNPAREASLGPKEVLHDHAAEPRFEVLYQLRSIRRRHGLRIKIRLRSDKLEVPSLAALWPAFDWQERETWDMYGVVFKGHPDLRRIYLYEQFVGYPLRKDYPKEKRQPLVRREWTDEVTAFHGDETKGGARG
jgi:NADH:ubiquinone oxidoreductase subunit C